MKSKNNQMLIFFFAMASLIQAQTMKWIPMEKGMAAGPCATESSKKQQLLCYALQYTPAASGTLTSYTTGFYVSCTSMGSPVAKSQSCLMVSNINLINGCEGSKVVLMNSSGNSGTIVNSQVEDGVPVILHEVCFDIPYGESITIKEDPVTDLTTSIDQTNGTPKTEYPSFTDITIRRDRYDASKPVWLDFKGIPAGDYISQLDWSTSAEKLGSHYIIERSVNGGDFIQIGRVEGLQITGPVNSYQFFDKTASPGKNDYRLLQVDKDGKEVSSPVRTVNFSVESLKVSISPNPADEYIEVNIQSPVAKSHIQLFDATGRMVTDEKNDNKVIKARLDVKKLNPGLYTVVVETDQDKYLRRCLTCWA